MQNIVAIRYLHIGSKLLLYTHRHILLQVKKMGTVSEYSFTPAGQIKKQLVIASQIKSRSDMTYQEHFAETTQIAVADNLIRYLTDADVCNLINSVLAGDKDKVFSSVEKLIDESVNALIELEQED